MMTLSDWAMLVATILGIASTLFMGLRWIVKSFLIELKPNGGSSMKDSIARLETRVDEIYRILAERNG
jgi:hypothetical protein